MRQEFVNQILGTLCLVGLRSEQTRQILLYTDLDVTGESQDSHRNGIVIVDQCLPFLTHPGLGFVGMFRTSPMSSFQWGRIVR
jgi:hypothetical protein